MDPSLARRGAHAAALVLLAVVLAFGNGAVLAKKGGKGKRHKTVTVVTAKQLHGWGYYDDQADSPLTPEFVKGPDAPPLGKGSSRLKIEDTSEGEILSANILLGTPLSDIQTLTYATYVASADHNYIAPTLQLGIDLDSTDGSDPFQGRLVYIPGVGGNTIKSAEWQTWNPLDDQQGDGSGNWFFSRAPGNAVCSQANPCTWSEVLTNFPNIRIHPQGGDQNNGAGLGFIGFKVGSGEGAIDANVDDLAVQLAGKKKALVVDFGK